MYEAYLVTETDNDDGDETSAQDWWWLVLEIRKTINAGFFFFRFFSAIFFSTLFPLYSLSFSSVFF